MIILGLLTPTERDNRLAFLETGGFLLQLSEITNRSAFPHITNAPVVYLGFPMKLVVFQYILPRYRCIGVYTYCTSTREKSY